MLLGPQEVVNQRVYSCFFYFFIIFLTIEIPQYLYEAGYASDQRMIACTQPRRIAATSIAQRVAEEMRSSIGSIVGYSIRFDEKVGKETRIVYLTDGMMINEIMKDPLLSKFSVVMLDEAHERSINTDILLGLLKK